MEKEQLIRIVSSVGNGAHVFAPREWLNEKVLIVRLGKNDIKEQIFEAIYPYLDKIISVVLYGSHARKEATEFSDIDVLLITKEKFVIPKKDKMDILIIPEDKIEKAIEINPIMMYSLFREGIALVNEQYLDNLREIQINPKLFKSFLDETSLSLNSDNELLKLDEKTGKFASSALIYSLFLRLRGIFILHCLSNKKVYFNGLFRKWILENCKINYEKFYFSYVSVRDNQKIKDEILISETQELLSFLEKELIGVNLK